ncbi:MAG: hypothetical protein HOK52_14785 [Candidatus Marinimicrobia bacterium]|mgnify:CR=1 FL=1|jgi:predicted kinase|nr:hypothetical protein [Candidatus Neomarinimicrobiota bacterium]
MKTFHQLRESLEPQELNEKLIMLSNGKRYGQIVFLAGGAGSGKGFAATNFMQSELFKIRDVDEWKTSFMKIADLKSNPEKYAKRLAAGSKIDPDKYKEIKGLNLKKSADVFKLHTFIDGLNIKDNTMRGLLSTMKNPATLPNIMFDITAKDINSVAKMMPDLLSAGYNPANIHMIWILTNYEVAIKNNAERDRVVPSDILLNTHEGAASTMFNLIAKKGKKLAINGAIHVVLNNRVNTITWAEGDVAKGGQKVTAKGLENRPLDKKGKKIGMIRDFKYLTMKERGKSIKSDEEVLEQLRRWILDNIPETDLKQGLSTMTDDQYSFQ